VRDYVAVADCSEDDDRSPDPGAVRMEAQVLRHRAHDKLMRAFLGPEVFDGTVFVAPHRAAAEQLRLAEMR
jgi:hypothetical protein